jgi:two-component system, chemotaxis family, sensor kinase CheA
MDDVLRQVVQIFAQEVKEQAQRIAQALLMMEGDPSTMAAQIEELYRQAHSLKGSSSSLGVTELEQLAHQLEEALMPVRRGTAPLTPELTDAALRAMDAARLRADGLVVDSRQGMAEVVGVTDELRAHAATIAATTSAGATGSAPAAASAAHAAGATGAAPAAAVAPATVDDGDTLRVAAARLAAVERRLDELRAVRGRLDSRSDNAAVVIGELEELWHVTRASARHRAAAVAPDRMYQVLRRVTALRRDLLDDAELAQANIVELDDNLRALRMVPFSTVKEPLQRAVRDACRRTDKDARLELVGGEQEVDRRLLEELKNPLVHLVRNAVDHGIELPDVREAVGKPSRACIEVKIEQRGADMLVDVRDDGRGIDLPSIRQKAIERGLYDEAAAAKLDERELYDLLFRSGFSTAEAVTELSGRGVGLDVVRDAVTKMHGHVELTSEPGRGTRFRLAVPLTVAGSETMLVRESDRTFALPQVNLERVVRAQLSELKPAAGRTYFHLDDHPIPVVRLARVLGLTERHSGSPWVMLAVMRAGAQRAAVVCERLLGSRDLVLRPLPPELAGLRLLDAAAILPDGSPILVLSPRALVEAAVEERAPALQPGFVPPGTVLVADDSITTRALLRNALEASGYLVRVAGDGDEALRLALTEPIDLVVSDVRMPRLDGFELTARLKADARTARLPVVLFSSLDSDEDRRRGTVSGASAYLTKGAYERGQLVDIVNSLIRGQR